MSSASSSCARAPSRTNGAWRCGALTRTSGFSTAALLRHCLREADLDGWPRDASRVILPMELIQREEHLEGDNRRPGLLTLEQPPRFDLLIVDEAHHVRNPATARYTPPSSSRRSPTPPCCSTATPVHTGAANLFTLLELLRPDLFPSFETFERMVEPNRYITEAMRHIRAGTPDGWRRIASSAVDAAAATQWGVEALCHNVQFTSWRERLLSPTRSPTRNESSACESSRKSTHSR